MTYCEFFRSITDFYPYRYQERVEQALLDGRSVVLRVPTGAGKTWAAVAPFLHSLETGHPIADRLLYALPLRSLAAGIYRRFSTVRPMHVPSPVQRGCDRRLLP